MSIRYQILKARLLDGSRFVGRIVLRDRYNQDRLVDRMLDMGTSLTRPDILAGLKLLETTIEKICSEGSKVALDGFVHFTPTMGGTFENESEGYDSSKNSVYVTTRISSAFNARYSQKVVVEKVEPRLRAPYFYEVDDLASDEVNRLVTSGGIVSIRGEHLKFSLENAEEYLRFVNVADVSVFVAVVRFQKMTAKEIVFLMPKLSFTSGYFEVASSMNTQVIKVGKSQNLTVIPASG